MLTSGLVSRIQRFLCKKARRKCACFFVIYNFLYGDFLNRLIYADTRIARALRESPLHGECKLVILSVAKNLPRHKVNLTLGRAGVRVSSGDLCIRKYAEAPTEPAGETLPPPQSFIRFCGAPSRLPLRFVRNRLFSAKFSLARADMEVRPYGLCVVVCSLQKAALAF